MAKAKPKKEATSKSKKPAAPKTRQATAAKRGKAASVTTAPNVVTTVTDDDIAKVAYAIWERQGRPTGQDADHWEAAKRELSAN